MPKSPLNASVPGSPAPEAPRPAASVPKPAPSIPPMTGGMVMPKKQEPEDIFNDLEGADDASKSSEIPDLTELSSSGTGMRKVIIIVAVVFGVAVLGFGGYLFYRNFIATAPAAEQQVTPEPVTPPTTPTVTPEPVPGGATPQEPVPPELAPVVPPTPNIPAPTPVTPGSATATGQQGMNPDDKTDTDGDGLTDYQEVNVWQTNPLVADTDGDGLADGDEVNVWHTNPLVADTDGDGFPDGSEVQNGYNPNGPGKLPGMSGATGTR
jgi:hypothetical protein